VATERCGNSRSINVGQNRAERLETWGLLAAGVLETVEKVGIAGAPLHIAIAIAPIVILTAR